MSEDGVSQAAEQAAQQAARIDSGESTDGTQPPTLEQRREKGREFVETAQKALVEAEAALSEGDVATATQLLDSLEQTANSLRRQMLVDKSTMDDLIRSRDNLLRKVNVTRSSEQQTTASQEAVDETQEGISTSEAVEPTASVETALRGDEDVRQAEQAAAIASPDAVAQPITELESTEGLVESVTLDSLQAGEIVHLATANGDTLQLRVTGSITDPDTRTIVPIFAITTSRADGSSPVELNMRFRGNESTISDGGRLRYMSADPKKSGYTSTPKITGITISTNERPPQIIMDKAREASSVRTQVAAEGVPPQAETVAEDSITGGSMPSETSGQSRIPADENGGAEVSSAEAVENGATTEPETSQTAPAIQEQQAPTPTKEKRGIFGWFRVPFRRKAQPNLDELSEAVTAAATPSVAEKADVPRTPLQRPESEVAPTPENTQAAAVTTAEPIPTEAAAESPVNPDTNVEVSPQQANTPSAEMPVPTAVEIAQTVEAAAAERANEIDTRRIQFAELLFALSTEYFNPDRLTEEVDVVTIAELIAQFNALRTETAALPAGFAKDKATQRIEMNGSMLDALVKAALNSNRLVLSESGMYYEAYKKLVALLSEAFKDRRLDKGEIDSIANAIAVKNIGQKPRKSEIPRQRKVVREQGVEEHRAKVNSPENRAARQAAVEAAAKRAIDGAVTAATSGVVLAEKGVVLVESAAAKVAGVGDEVQASVLAGVRKASEVTDAAIATVLSVQAIPYHMRANLGEVAQGVREAYWQVEDGIREQVVNNAGAAIREVRGIFGGLREVGRKLKESVATIGPAFAQVADRMTAQSTAAAEARTKAREQTSNSAAAASEAVRAIAKDRQDNPKGFEKGREILQSGKNL